MLWQIPPFSSPGKDDFCYWEGFLDDSEINYILSRPEWHNQSAAQIGGGFDGTNVVNYIEFVQESPMPRTLFGSGGGDLTVDVKFVQSGTEYDSIGIGGTYTIRFKISGYNSSYTGTSTTINLLQIG